MSQPAEAPRIRIKETVVLKKFDGDWTDEQHERGESEHALVEELTIEDGEVVAHWKKEAGRGSEEG